MQVTLEQVREIIDSNDGNQAAPIASFTEIKSTSYRYAFEMGSDHIKLLSRSSRVVIVTATRHPGNHITSFCLALTEPISCWFRRPLPPIHNREVRRLLG